ncbi:cellulase family glycosylhydrolase [Streptomyces sp. TRM 70351]|uniref:cellulase family glycosylhydrolase n=1 Tax=Streptomyces sp. TRM 70351 TaxID=3116552 RepID=UPI002E7AC788|nr:cellulase family glycosylhydrolase [Streptomyces sp. TRM 70351]MEE1930645.1 cellulase family glycosylhydrolase [Streptomyces sp. TRM 70351]
MSTAPPPAPPVPGRGGTVRRRLALPTAAVTLLGMLLALLGLGHSARAGESPSALATGFRVSDGRLLERDGNDFVMRGVNHPHAWYTHQTGSFADIKATGANTVRVVLSSGHQWTRSDTADVANVISLCKENRLICVLEVHDTTGYGEAAAAATLDQAADYWISVRSALAGQEDYVILNIGNEPIGNTGYERWTADTRGAIQKLRAAGFDHTIMVDAPNWGQDWSHTMRDNAASVFAADPDRNTVFSVHMYGVYDTAAEIRSYLTHFVDAGLPILVGEFGFDHSDGNPDEDTILATAEELGLGYLGWSWSGNGGGVEYLDLVNGFDPNALSPWGERLIHGPNGIAETAEEAAVYGGDDGGGDDGGGDDGDAACAVSFRVVGQWQDGFQGEVVIRNTGTTAIDGWTLAWDFPGQQRVANLWGGTATQSGASVSVAAASYTAGIAPAGSVTLGFVAQGDGAGAAPAAFTLNGNACTAG